MIEPLQLDFKLADFDLSLLPNDIKLLKGNEKALKVAIAEHLRGVFSGLPGELRLTSYDDRISILWVPHRLKDVEAMTELAIKLLQQGAFSQAEPILRIMASRQPDNSIILFNYGMMLSDQRRLDEAREMLGRLTRVAPDFANGWGALGVALSRQGKDTEAIAMLEKSIELDPVNGYTMRNLGALIGKKDPAKALPFLKRAAELLPSDQAAQYAYAHGLFQANRCDEADALLIQAIALNEYSEIAELCRQDRTDIAHRNMRNAAPGGIRMDVVMYCLAALKKFRELGHEKTQAITFEIAMLGRGGLNINDPDSRYRLKSMPGEFSGLQLVSYMYVGMKQLMPQMNPGIDFSREYGQAKLLFGEEDKMKNDWQSLRDAIVTFRDARDWKQFHTPKNLSLAIAVEAAELQERFMWQTDTEAMTALVDPQNRKRVAEELADVIIFSLLFADSLDLDVERIVRQKLRQNSRKYPVKKAKGNHRKYSELGG